MMTLLPRPFRDWSTYPDHGGIDYGMPRGTPVPASGPGWVDWSGYYSERGGFAKFVTYDNGERWGYYHFDREAGPSVGTRVDTGTTLQFVGSLGKYSTGPHLHHEVWVGGAIIRPPAYWDHVNKNSYVGDGTPASGGTEPIEEDDMPYTPEELKAIGKKAAWEAVTGVLTDPLFREALTRDIAATVHDRKVPPDTSGTTGTLAETARDARRIARRAEEKIDKLADALGVDLAGT